MHSKGKGSSGSNKPNSKMPPVWSNDNKEEVEELILTLSKEGNSTAVIGTILRDRYAVPNVRLVLGKRIATVLAENSIGGTYPEDMMNLMQQAVGIINHLGSGNHKDLHNRRQLELCESKIRRLARYYKGNGNILETWTYKRDQLRLMVE